MKIDVIVPVYKPGSELLALLDGLSGQTLPVNQIIIMNTEEKYFEQLVYGTGFWDKYKNVKVFHLTKKEFDHGKTRHMGVLKSDADVFVMMTQDALPSDSHLLERLVNALDENVAVAYARQLPTDECSILERFTREFNYPDKNINKSKADLERLGIKTYFCSNVCAAYKREIYDKQGGFVNRAIFNEDMIYAARAVEAGYHIAYAADAKVYHAHNYTNMQQLRRNFDLGVSQAEHPEIFKGLRSESEGKKLVSAATKYLRKNHKTFKIPYFYIQCGYKYMGYLLGKHYRKLPKKLVLKITTNKEYWC